MIGAVGRVRSRRGEAVARQIPTLGERSNSAGGSALWEKIMPGVEKGATGTARRRDRDRGRARFERDARVEDPTRAKDAEPRRKRPRKRPRRRVPGRKNPPQRGRKPTARDFSAVREGRATHPRDANATTPSSLRRSCAPVALVNELSASMRAGLATTTTRYGHDSGVARGRLKLAVHSEHTQFYVLRTLYEQLVCARIHSIIWHSSIARLGGHNCVMKGAKSAPKRQIAPRGRRDGRPARCPPRSTRTSSASCARTRTRAVGSSSRRASSPRSRSTRPPS